MLVNASSLPNALAQGQHRCFLLSGDEPLFVQESCDHIRRYARQQGAEQREYIQLEKNQSSGWQALTAAAQTLGLFSSIQLIEVDGGNAKPDKQGHQLIPSTASDSTDNFYLYIFPAIDYQARKAKWFQNLEKSPCLIVNTQPLFPNQVRPWLIERCRSNQLNLSKEALETLDFHCEGNLLAYDQSIKKLLILFGNQQQIEPKHIIDATEDSARFDVFQLVDTLLAGNTTKALKILANLKAAGLAEPIIVWALAKEARLLLQLCHGQEQGKALSALFPQLKVWRTRQEILSKATRRSTTTFWKQQLADLHRIDLSIKGIETSDTWTMLEKSCIRWGNQGSRSS